MLCRSPGFSCSCTFGMRDRVSEFKQRVATLWVSSSVQGFQQGLQGLTLITQFYGVSDLTGVFGFRLVPDFASRVPVQSEIFQPCFLNCPKLLNPKPYFLNPQLHPECRLGHRSSKSPCSEDPLVRCLHSV